MIVVKLLPLQIKNLNDILMKGIKQKVKEFENEDLIKKIVNINKITKGNPHDKTE